MTFDQYMLLIKVESFMLSTKLEYIIALVSSSIIFTLLSREQHTIWPKSEISKQVIELVFSSDRL